MNTNNKKFRKSTIVIPALALMVLTVGASATGAVAWFTATRQVTATASTFTAASTTSALTIKTTHGQGTHTSATDNTEANDGNVYVNTSNNTTAATANYLCDASFDATSGKLYHTNLNDDGKVGSFAVIDSSVADYSYDTGKKTNDGSHEIFYAVDWTYTFSYQTTNPHGTALLLDRKTSTFSINTSLAAGFRIAFVNTATSAPYRVWTNSATSTYIKDTTASYDTSSSLVYDTSYDASHIVQTSTSYSRVEDSSISSGNLASLPEYLGTFTSGSSPVNTITIKCTAWYEGTDSSVVNGNLTKTGNQAITANMNFYVRDLA